MSVFKNIADTIDNSKIIRTAQSLDKNFKATHADSLETAARFAYDLYFRNHEAEALSVCHLLSAEQFTGNHNLWTWIELAILLEAWIYENRGDKDNQEKAITKLKVVFDFDYGDPLKNAVNKKVRARRILDDQLCYDRIAKAMNEKDRESELGYRRIQFGKLLYLHHFGGSEIMPLARVDQEIAENLNIIRRII